MATATTKPFNFLLTGKCVHCGALVGLASLFDTAICDDCKSDESKQDNWNADD